MPEPEQLVSVRVKVNGKEHKLQVEPRLLLVELLPVPVELVELSPPPPHAARAALVSNRRAIFLWNAGIMHSSNAKTSITIRSGQDELVVVDWRQRRRRTEP